MTLQTRGLTTLERAVFEAVAYADVFDFPVALEEIHRALPLVVSRADVESTLPHGALEGAITTSGDHYVLSGRESLVDVRSRRADASAKLRGSATTYGALIAKLPFVRMVALTGSLAVDNADAGDDIDYLIVTAKGRLWLARGLTMLVVRLAKLRGLTLCPNYLLSESALALPERDVYTARELLQMQPVAGHETYRRMLRENAWCHDVLPNWEIEPRREAEGRSLVARLGERLLGGRRGDTLERWLMRHKAAELREQGGGNTEAVFDEDVCKGHFDAHRARLQQALAKRMQRLEVEP
jgi:hypothetical protein